MEGNADLLFGPIPSRRLGQSLGINNTLLPKACTYNCVYCQAGRTHHLGFARKAFLEPRFIYQQVAERLQQAQAQSAQIDYLSFVPDGEPTLDIRLGETLALLRTLGKPIAVFTNASLIWRPDVRADLCAADWVSLKFDAVDERSWQKIDRPSKYLQPSLIMDGALAFARQYRGTLVSETMLCAGLNDDEESLTATAEYLAQLNPAVAYIGIPTRPPLEAWAMPPDDTTLAKAFDIFSSHLPRVELIAGYPPPVFQPGNDAERNIPAILAVHPLRESEMQDLLQKYGADPTILDRLREQGIVQQVAHRGEQFWMRVR